jgi:hypothetical protein
MQGWWSSKVVPGLWLGAAISVSLVWWAGIGWAGIGWGALRIADALF